MNRLSAPIVPGRPEASVRVHTLRDVTEWDRIEADWRKLHAASPTASAPLRWEWLREWWRVYGLEYGDGGRGLRVLTVWRDALLIGALPLYLRSGGGTLLGARRLQFLSTGEAEFEETCADYLDLLHLPDDAATCLDALGAELAGWKEWDELELTSVADVSPLVGWQLEPTCRRTVESSSGGCPIANLDGGLEAYVARLSAKSRAQARRSLRSAEGPGIVFEVASETSDVDSFFDQLVLLHQRRWEAVGEPGCFSASRFTEFHRTLCRRLVPAGQAVLAQLLVGSEPIGVLYGILAGSRFEQIQTGIAVDQSEIIHSPGWAVNLLLMEHLAKRGVIYYDFLKDSAGSTSYKKKMATEERGLLDFRIVRPTLRAASSLAAKMSKRLAKGDFG